MIDGNYPYSDLRNLKSIQIVYALFSAKETKTVLNNFWCKYHRVWDMRARGDNIQFFFIEYLSSASKL